MGLIIYCLISNLIEHIQHSSFFSSSVFWLFNRLHYNSPLEKIIRILVISICGVATALVCYGRIYLQYHTMSQVFWGSLVGCFTGILWFMIVHFLLTPFFPIVVSWWVSIHLDFIGNIWMNWGDKLTLSSFKVVSDFSSRYILIWHKFQLYFENLIFVQKSNFFNLLFA